MTFLFYHLLTQEGDFHKEANWNIAKNLVGKALTGAKSIAKTEWNSMDRFGKAMTALPVVTTVPGMANKLDDQGRSRAERLTGLAGNIGGGLVGSGLGTRAGGAIQKALGNSKIGKGIGTVATIGAQVAGGMGGMMAGEQGAAAPFKLLRKQPIEPTYNTSPQQSAPQQQFPLQSIPR